MHACVSTACLCAAYLGHREEVLEDIGCSLAQCAGKVVYDEMWVRLTDGAHLHRRMHSPIIAVEHHIHIHTCHYF